MLSRLLLAAGLAAQATASTIRVNVGPGLVFAPNSFNASKGDVVEFHFYARNHSVVQGDFDNACNPAPSSPFFSGFFPTNGTSQNDKVFSVTVNDTQPIVFYCSQNTGAHCSNGMAGVINPTNSSNLQNYLSNAKNVQIAISPDAVSGGVIGQAPPEPSTTVGTTGGSTTSPTAAPTTSKPNAAGAVKVSSAGLAVVVAVALYAM